MEIRSVSSRPLLGTIIEKDQILGRGDTSPFKGFKQK